MNRDSKAKKLVLFTLGDIHATVESWRKPLVYVSGPAGALPTRGGLRSLLSNLVARAAAVRNNEKADEVLILHCGDILGETGDWKTGFGLPVAGLLSETIRSLMPDSLLVSTVGNHDAKFGFGSLHDLVKALTPTVCHNIIWRGRNYFGKEYHPLCGPFHVTILGLTTAEIHRYLRKPDFQEAGVQLDKSIDLQEVIGKLRNGVCSFEYGVLIALTHCSHEEIARADVLAQCDIIIGGHDHAVQPVPKPLPRFPNYLNTGAHGHYFGEIQLLVKQRARPSIERIALSPVVGRSDELLEPVEKIYCSHRAKLAPSVLEKRRTPVGWLERTVTVYTSIYSSINSEDHEAGRLYAMMLADQAQEEFAEAIGRSHIIGMIPAGHFRGGQLVGLEDLGRDWPPDDPCIADTAILEGELRDFVPDADNKLVLARIAADQLATVLGHGIFSGKASRFLHFVGCRIYLTSDLRLVIGLPCQQSPWLWIATTSRVVNPQQREKSYAPLDSICEEQPLSSRVAIPDLAVQYFKRHSLMIRQPIAIPAPSVEKGVYSYIRSLGKSQGSRVLGGATLQWGD